MAARTPPGGAPPAEPDGPLPAPLVPAFVDLTGFGYFPVDVAGFLASGFNDTPNDAAWRAGVMLMFAAWQQVPSGTLPDDDAALARLADLGRDVRTWRRLRAEALRGWTLCSDNRLHHPAVATRALEAAHAKLAQRIKSNRGNERRWGSADPQAAAALLADLASVEAHLRRISPTSSRLASQRAHRDRPDDDEEHVPVASREESHAESHKDRKLREEKGREGNGEEREQADGVRHEKKDVFSPVSEALREDVGSRLSAGWQPSDADRQHYTRLGLPADGFAEVVRAFTDYWAAQPGERGKSGDWGAAWRNWCRKRTELNANRPQQRKAEPSRPRISV